jgi:hypothetical protein
MRWLHWCPRGTVHAADPLGSNARRFFPEQAMRRLSRPMIGAERERGRAGPGGVRPASGTCDIRLVYARCTCSIGQSALPFPAAAAHSFVLRSGSIVRKHASRHRRHSVRGAMARDSGALLLDEDNRPESAGEDNRFGVSSGDVRAWRTRPDGKGSESAEQRRVLMVAKRGPRECWWKWNGTVAGGGWLTRPGLRFLASWVAGTDHARPF